MAAGSRSSGRAHGEPLRAGHLAHDGGGGRRARIHPTAQLGAGVEVGADSVIGKDCRLGAGTIVGARTTIEQGVSLGERSRVGEETTIREHCAFGQETRIGSRCELGRGSGESLQQQIREGGRPGRHAGVGAGNAGRRRRQVARTSSCGASNWRVSAETPSHLRRGRKVAREHRGAPRLSRDDISRNARAADGGLRRCAENAMHASPEQAFVGTSGGRVIRGARQSNRGRSGKEDSVPDSARMRQ